MDVNDLGLDINHCFSGNILLFYAFDFGDEIDLNTIKQKGILDPLEVPLSSYFKNYRVPYSFKMMESCASIDEKKGNITGTGCVLSKLYHFGVLSLCYQIPFNEKFDDLKLKLIEVKRKFDMTSEVDARNVFNKISSRLKKPRFYNLKSDYFAIQVNPLPEKIMPEDFKDLYGAKIASLLRLEVKPLSDYQIDQILSSSTGYYGQDLIIIDSKAAFVYDNEYFEPLEFFESSNVQMLELQYYDHLIDDRLTYFYGQQSHRVPFLAYLPLMGERFDSPISRLANLKVDISVITEQLENSVKMTGDAYYLNFYALLVEKLYLRDWRDSINRKLRIVQDLNTIYQDRLDTIHEEMLTVVIIVLIAFEAFMAFIR
ncbi:MAG: hypothetical protein WCS92_00330 [Candidatus Babeliales bacterium]|jgi:hypothetical protein